MNQLYHNIIWTQQSNYLGRPLTALQRDERLGWTGDAQAYVKSAAFNDIAAFGTKWMVDLNDAQLTNGAYPLYAPAPSVRATDTYSPGWMEAGIIYPYQLFRSYNDIKVIKKNHWPEMQRFMQFLEAKSKGEYVFKETAFAEVNPKGGFGDWLSVGKKTPPDMLACIMPIRLN
ncbi:MAG: hypothetical protein R2822_10820 [Spirosomataceae bacterium]